MNKKTKFRYLFFLVLIILILIIILYLQKKVILFEIKKYPSGDTVICEVVQPGEIIKTSYRHSVATTTVWEIYEVIENYKLIQRETHFYDSIAGMPYAAFGDEIFIMEDGKCKIKNMNRVIPLPLNYNIGAIRENYLYLKNNKINLSELTGDMLVTINLRKVNQLQIFKMDWCSDNF